MKKLSVFSVLLVLALINTAAMCDDAEETTPNTVSIIGRWKLKGYQFTQAKTDGSTLVTNWLAETAGVDVYWEFMDDGRFKSSDGNSTLDARWELKIKSVDGDEIVDSTLRIFGNPALKDLNVLIGTDDLEFDMDCGRLSSGQLQMGCLVDATNASPQRLKTSIYYTYVKQ